MSGARSPRRALVAGLADTAHLLESAVDPASRLERVLVLLRSLVGYDACALAEKVGGENRWLLAPEPTAQARSAQIAALEPLLRLVEGRDHDARASSGLPWRHHLALPLVGLDQVRGLLVVGRDDEPYDEEALAVLSVVAAQVASYLTANSLHEASEQALLAHQERLRAMAFEAAVAEERERRRIAVALHDQIGQHLSLVQIKLGAARKGVTGAPRATLDDAAALLERSIEDTRSAVFELSPPILYELGIGAALSWLAEDVAKRYGLRVAVTDDGAAKPLDDTAAATVFRAVRELLFNVRKYAGTPTANVSLARTDDRLEVVVEDAGAGFDPEAPSPGAGHVGFGLLSIREQLARLAGTIEITASPGAGTRVRLRVPLRSGAGAVTRS